MKIEGGGLEKAIRLSETEALIVAFLAKNGETHAYGIASGLGRASLRSSIYIYLNRLQKKGVIDSKTIIKKRKGVRVPQRLVKLKPEVRRIHEKEVQNAQTGKESHLVYA